MRLEVQIALCLSLIFGVSLGGLPASAEPAPQDSSRVGDGRAFVILPVFFYSPETKLAGGAGWIYSFRRGGGVPSARPSTIQSLLIYTQKNQIISVVDTETYWSEEAYRLDAETGYTKFPDLFHGIGPETGDFMEEDYTDETFLLGINLRRRISRALRLGVLYDFLHISMTETEDGGLLESGVIPGSRGGDVSGVGVLADWDTRDNIFNPSKGSYHLFSATFFGSGLGGDFTFDRYYLDLRKYVSLGGSSVLAMQGVGHFTSGDVPFQMLPMVGGDSLLRGYYEGRYRDAHAAVVQAEYRRRLTDRWGLTAFAGAGTVASDPDAFRLDTTKPSGGLGVRYMFSRSEGINVRLDVAFGKDSSGFYINAGEAF